MRDQESWCMHHLLHRGFAHHRIYFLPRHATPAGPEEEAWNSAFDFENVGHQPHEEIPNVPRSPTCHDEPALAVIRIAEKAYATAADRYALPKGRKTERA